MFLPVPKVALTVGLLVAHGCFGMPPNRFDPYRRPNPVQPQNRYSWQHSFPVDYIRESGTRLISPQQPPVQRVHNEYPSAYQLSAQPSASAGYYPSANTGWPYPSTQEPQYGNVLPNESSDAPLAFLNHSYSDLEALLDGSQWGSPHVGANIDHTTPNFYQPPTGPVMAPPATSLGQPMYQPRRSASIAFLPSVPVVAPNFQVPRKIPTTLTAPLPENVPYPGHQQYATEAPSQEPSNSAVEDLHHGSRIGEDAEFINEEREESNSEDSDSDYIPSDTEKPRRGRVTRKEDQPSSGVISYKPWNKQRKRYIMKLCRRHEGATPSNFQVVDSTPNQSDLSRALDRIKKLHRNNVELLPSEIRSTTLKKLRDALQNHVYFYVILWDNEARQATVQSPYSSTRPHTLACNILHQIMDSGLHIFNVITEPAPKDFSNHIAGVVTKVNDALYQR